MIFQLLTILPLTVTCEPLSNGYISPSAIIKSQSIKIGSGVVFLFKVMVVIFESNTPSFTFA
jgi:hypothetical protein